MTRLLVYVQDKAMNSYVLASLTVRQYRRLDNGVMVSCGLSVPEDVSRETVARWVKRGRARQVTYDEWNHGGCQSSCVTRGGSKCRW